MNAPHETLEELVEQYTELARTGQAPAPIAFAKAHPDFADELQELLPLVADMSQASQDRMREMQDAQELPQLPGTDFQLLRLIGSGAMGQIYEAIQLSLDRRCAVKLLAISLLRNPEQRRLFEQESRVIARLHHPNIVEVFSAGSTPDRCYYAMELIEGTSLDNYQPASLQEVAKIGMQAARALAYAHRCGVIHRDIKPANLLLEPSGKLLVSDFGIAASLTDNQGYVEEGRSGTLRYMSPERLKEGLNSYAADQYALGATLYELASRQPLFPENDRNALIARISAGDLPKLHFGDVEMEAIVNRCLAPLPQNRYASMDALAEDLEHYLNHEPVQAAASSPLRRLVLWTRRKPLVAGLLLCLIAFAVSLVMALAIGYHHTRMALVKVEQNAAVADAVLQQIFARVEEQSPSRKNSAMLSLLLPYYQSIVRSTAISSEQLETANRIIGTCALHDGSYPLAEASFRNMLALQERASTLNLLAEALTRQGKAEEASRVREQVVSQYAYSPDAAERHESVKALLVLDQRKGGPAFKQAFKLLSELLEKQPENPELLLEYARIRGSGQDFTRGIAIRGIEQDPYLLLQQLIKQYPTQPEYGLALTKLMMKRLKDADTFRMREWNECEATLAITEHLLALWPNDPTVIDQVGRFQLECINTMLARGYGYRARRTIDRLVAVLELLSQNPEVDPSICASLRQLQQVQENERKNTFPVKPSRPGHLQ